MAATFDPYDKSSGLPHERQSRGPQTQNPKSRGPKAHNSRSLDPQARTPPRCQRHRLSAFKVTSPQSPTHFWAATTSKLATWYFGPMSRQDATDLLMGEKEGGVFLVRDSTTIHGDFVLCVREDSKVSHYIINKIQQGEQTRYRIGDQMFPDLPACLQFYKLHYLDTTPLIRPAPRRIEKVIAKYDFEGSDQDDLPFKKGEILTVVSKDEDQWWTARNTLGQTGSIPVPYIQKYEDSQQSLNEIQRPGSGGGNPVSQQEAAIRRTNIQILL
uniref:Crk-like protein n=1 Tax=Timema genevievae TaxID=629358 RepID=A0A7R9PNE9_TIMGE|nr:unnamed protein product [Timema genevievae]